VWENRRGTGWVHYTMMSALPTADLGRTSQNATFR
jgi:hypothetical protein